MKRAVCLWLVALLWPMLAHTQDSAGARGQTVVVIPFENTSATPGLEWIGEAFAEVLHTQLDSPVIYVASRDERLRAYDRQGVPAEVHPSRATLYRIAEQMDVDYAVLGSYRYDGANLTATAQLLDMRAQRLMPASTESGRLPDLANLQSAVAWDLLRQIRSDFSISKDQYVAGKPSMRIDPLENYVLGLMANNPEQKIQYFREAVRLNPGFAQAWLELGMTYFGERSHDAAIAAFQKIPPNSEVARKANFYLGLSYYAHGDFEKAQAAFEFVAARLPLAEVYNNLGVVAARRGQKQAVDDFERALADDPNDEDYHFNLAVALSQMGDKAGALREIHSAQEHRPNDAEAKLLLDSLAPTAGGVVASAATSKMPVERMKRNYEEDAFQQMTVELAGWAEQRFARSDLHAHARYHLELGKELLAHGFTSEAEGEFRHAAAIDPSSPAPLAALADAFEMRGDAQAARTEAEASLRMHESVDAYLVLTRLDLEEGHTDAATADLGRALELDPRNAAAQDLRRTLAAKIAEKGQP